MQKLCKSIRVLTLAPVLAAISILCIFFGAPDVFPSVWHLVYMLFFLGLLPLLAYPLQPIVPKFRDKGRDGQRTLAMLFAVAGYILCAITSLFMNVTEGMWLIVLEYLLSGLLILLFNKGFHVKLSAHGCGAAGPIVLLLYFGLPLPSGIMAVFTVLTFYASVKMKRHTVAQLMGGSFVSVLLLCALSALFHFL